MRRLPSKSELAFVFKNGPREDCAFALRDPSDHSSLPEYVAPFDRTTHRPNLDRGDFDQASATHLLHNILVKLAWMKLFDIGWAAHAPLPAYT
jgi:hypothetical protein